MSLKNLLRSIVPGAARRKIKSFIKSSAAVDTGAVLRSLYNPVRYTERPMGAAAEVQKLGWSPPSQVAEPTAGVTTEPLPVPPWELRMGYTGGGDRFIEAGTHTIAWLRRILAREGLNLTAGTHALEWGCASGRVLRHFLPEAQAGCEFWGLDQDAPHLEWARRHLSPPFRFLTCTAYPHLPLRDGSVDFVYGISVFTHLVHLVDTWLAEFARVVRKGGLAIFTIHDESTLRFYKERPQETPYWHEGDDLAAGLPDDVTVYRDAEDWGHTFTYFKSDYVRREWAQFFDVVSLEPQVEGCQTAVVLRARG